MRKLVIIESPFRGKTTAEQNRNIEYARGCIKDSFGRGESPYASHLLYTSFLDETNQKERDAGIDAGLEWGKVAEMVAVYCDFGITEGMAKGIERATERGLNIEYRTLYPLKDKNIRNPRNLASFFCRCLGVSLEDMRSRSRLKELCDARHLYCAVSKYYFPRATTGEIGDVIARNHATVICSIRRVEEWKDLKFRFKEIISLIQSENEEAGKIQTAVDKAVGEWYCQPRTRPVLPQSPVAECS